MIYVIIVIITLVISYLFVSAVDKIKNDHPDYDGDDFLNW